MDELEASHTSCVSELVRILEEIAPRGGVGCPGADDDLGFFGNGLTLGEYLWLLETVAAWTGVALPDDVWPTSLGELARLSCDATSGERDE